MSKPIAMLTDFGTTDSYVGIMKAVIKNIVPDANIIDITHAIAPQHVRQAAFELFNAHRYFPNDTIFLVVVDPGVGTARRPIIVQAGNYTFIAPDNGVLSYTLSTFDAYLAYTISNPRYQRAEISHTFHGRDIFAPAAGHIAAGIRPTVLGPALGEVMALPRPELMMDEKRIVGEVIHMDYFGNIISSIGQIIWYSPERLTLKAAFQHTTETRRILAEHATVHINSTLIKGIKPTYGEVARGEIAALIGSSGFLEIAVNQGNAQQKLDVAIGDRVELHIGDIDAAIRH